MCLIMESMTNVDFKTNVCGTELVSIRWFRYLDKKKSGVWNWLMDEIEFSQRFCPRVHRVHPTSLKTIALTI